MKSIGNNIITILAAIIIITIMVFVIFEMIDYIRSGKEQEYENNLRECMSIYHDYEYCKYRSY